MLLSLVLSAPAAADAPLTQGFEDGAPGWTKTGMWRVQSNPAAVTVDPAITSLVTLSGGLSLPAAIEGQNVAWFGEPATGTYCGSDFDSLKQTSHNGCTSTGPKSGALTSPAFSLDGVAGPALVFRAWWEIEAVNPDIADLMQLEYSVDAGASWTPAGKLNPETPAWGGRHQAFTDEGARASGGWQTYSAPLAGAANQPNVQVRFVFDTVDSLRNGFRGLLVDGLAVVDGLGDTVTQPSADSFTDAPPGIAVTDVTLDQGPDGGWKVDFDVTSTHTSSGPVSVDWDVNGQTAPAATGTAIVPAGSTSVPASVPVSGTDAPYVVSIANPSGGTIAPGGATASTQSGAVPLVRLESVSATASGSDLLVHIDVRLSEPRSVPVTVDYTLTGSDGVAGPGGTITIPVGATQAGIDVRAPNAHAPYTVGLSNARNALIDPNGASAGTGPVAGTSALTGTQLVLGVRQVGGLRPAFGRSFLVSYVSGTVRYHRPGRPYERLRSGTLELPLGSVVDTVDGRALITVASDATGTLQQGEFWDGKFGVFQTGGRLPYAELRLAGGDYSACPGASRNATKKQRRRARRTATRRVRTLWASAKGRFRTRGRFAAGTIRGTRWQTEDLCLATRVTVAEGVVAVYDFRRKRTRIVGAGDSVTIGALQSARYRKRRGVSPPRLSRQ